MLKMELFDCAINEKCCSVDGGRGICCLFFRPYPGGFDSSRVPTPGNLPSEAKKIANARKSAGGAWAQVELTDALLTELKIVQKRHIKYENGAACDWKSAKTS